MTSEIDIPSLYRGRVINLWVEDAVVAAYLREVWSDPEIHILIGGGLSAVDAMSKHAVENRYPNVFGLVDRDFGVTNHSDWMTPEKTFHRFVLTVHEAENLLIDPAGLAGCSVNDNRKTVEEITERLTTLATSLAPYMACRAVITELRHLVLDAFPSHPSRDAVPDIAAAESLIVSSEWFGKIVVRTQATATANEVRRRLNERHSEYLSDLQTDRWQQTFSGKELFRDIVSFIYRGTGVRGQQRDIDAAKAIARWQFQNKVVPKEILDLRIAMRRRLGLS